MDIVGVKTSYTFKSSLSLPCLQYYGYTSSYWYGFHSFGRAFTALLMQSTYLNSSNSALSILTDTVKKTTIGAVFDINLYPFRWGQNACTGLPRIFASAAYSLFTSFCSSRRFWSVNLHVFLTYFFSCCYRISMLVEPVKIACYSSAEAIFSAMLLVIKWKYWKLSQTY